MTCVLVPGTLRAQTTPQEFEAKLGYETGNVTFKGGIATIHVPNSFRFLGPEGSQRLLTEAWGNPAEASDDVLGTLVPAKVSPVSKDGWGIVITYDEDGYVNDSDAAKIDYASMLKQMQDDATASSDERQKQAFESVRLVGWADPPHYDANSHKLYWAKELMFGSSAEHTLNYNIRILGRRGVLVLNAVAGMPQLGAIRAETANGRCVGVQEGDSRRHHRFGRGIEADPGPLDVHRRPEQHGIAASSAHH